MPKKLTCSQTFLYKDLVKRLKKNGYEGDFLDDVKKNLIKVYKNPLGEPYWRIDFNKDLINAFYWNMNGGHIYWYDVYKRTFS